jgi:hypothetical protein
MFLTVSIFRRSSGSKESDHVTIFNSLLLSVHIQTSCSYAFAYVLFYNNGKIYDFISVTLSVQSWLHTP